MDGRGQEVPRRSPDAGWTHMMTSVRVIRVVLAVGQPLPVYPDEQTSSDSVGMSRTCQHIWLRANESAPLGRRVHETDPTIHRLSFRARARARPRMTIVVNGRYGPK